MKSIIKNIYLKDEDKVKSLPLRDLPKLESVIYGKELAITCIHQLCRKDGYLEMVLEIFDMVEATSKNYDNYLEECQCGSPIMINKDQIVNLMADHADIVSVLEVICKQESEDLYIEIHRVLDKVAGHFSIKKVQP